MSEPNVMPVDAADRRRRVRRMAVLLEKGRSERRPTRANIEREFRRLAEQAHEGDQVVILLAGHGARQPADPDNHEPDGIDEIRGEFWDIGRMKAEDPRLSTIDLSSTFHMDPNAPWPKPGEITAIIASSVPPAQPRKPFARPALWAAVMLAVCGAAAGGYLLRPIPDAPVFHRIRGKAMSGG